MGHAVFVVKGSEDVTKVNNTYLHDFPIDESQTEFQEDLSLRVQNSAGWYGVLIAVAVALFVFVALSSTVHVFSLNVEVHPATAVYVNL